MMRQSSFLQAFLYLPLLLATSPATAQIGLMDTSVPNQFEFISAHYFASKGTTNVAVMVKFTPGNRSWTGSVNYSTGDGTAISHQDYVPVTGSLIFSGNAYQSFIVPVFSGVSNEAKTVLLFLSHSPSDTNAIITRSNAVLTINLPPPPDLTITPGQNGTVLVSWPDDGSDVILEKRTSPAATWNYLSTGYVDGDTRWHVDVPDEMMAFYRLRRPQ